MYSYWRNDSSIAHTVELGRSKCIKGALTIINFKSWGVADSDISGVTGVADFYPTVVFDNNLCLWSSLKLTLS